MGAPVGGSRAVVGEQVVEGVMQCEAHIEAVGGRSVGCTQVVAGALGILGTWEGEQH